MVKLFVNLAVIAATVAIAYARPQVEKDETIFEAHANGCPVSWDIHHLKPHEYDCTRFYYCVRGEKVPRQCSPGTHFNPELQVCDWPENAGCGLSGGGGGGDVSTSDDDDDDVEGSGDPGSISRESGETEDVLANGCPADFDVHKLLPHETECNRFYYCVFGEKVERGCAPGTYFNYKIQVCDWPENVDCANSGSGGGDNGSGEGNGNGSGEGNGNGSGEGNGNGSGEGNGNGSGEGNGNGSGEGNGNGSGEGNGNGSGEGNGNGGDENGTLENGCPADWDIHQLLPHETECNQFYQCVHGEKVERECAPGTHFNPTLQVCDWPHNAGCGNSGNGDSNENSGGSSNENNNSGNSNESDNGDGSDENNNNSGNSNEGDNGDGSDENNNNSGNSNEGDNGDGSDENNNSGNSNEGDNGGDSNENNNSGNSNEGDNSGESTEWLPNGCPANHDIHHLLPHETECNLFYSCAHGDLIERECGPGTHFNPTLQVCDWPNNAGCANNGGGSGSDESNSGASGSSEEPDNGVTENPGTGSGENPGSGSGEWLENGCPTDWNIHYLRPHETECNLFYYCVHGILVLRECSPGTHFNPSMQVCDWPQNAGCANGGGGGGGGGGSGSSEEPDNGVTENPGSGSGENPGSGSGEWLENGCPSDSNIHHLLPHEDDCTRFYYCVNKNLVVRDCPPGLHFNPKVQVCDWPENAGCANGGGNTDSPGSGSGEDNVTDGPGSGSGEDNNVTDGPGSGSGEDNNVTDGPGSGSGEDNNVTEGPGSGSGEDNNVTEGPGSGSGEDNNVTEGPGSGSGEDNNVTEGPGNGSGEVTDGPASGSGEWLENGCPADWEVDHLQQHENDCTKFYFCVHGNLVESSCAPGTHFNAAAQECDWPENAGCANNGGNTDGPGSGSGEVTEEDRPVTEGPGDESEEVTEGDRPTSETPGGESEEVTEGDRPTTESDEVTEGVWTTTENPESGEVEPSPQDRLCASGCNVGQWAHDTDCDKFWRCNGGQAVLGVCSEGLHFNAEEQTCDFICNVNCVRDTIQATVGTNGLKLFVPWDKIDDKLLSAYQLLV